MLVDAIKLLVKMVVLRLNLVTPSHCNPPLLLQKTLDIVSMFAILYAY